MAFKRVLLVLAAVVAATLLLFFLMNQQSRRLVDRRFRQLALAEARTIDRVMAVAGTRLLRDGEDSLIAFLSRMMEDDPVVYVALRDKTELRFADTKFEGFLPIGRQPGGVRIIPTHVGPILEINTTLAAGPDGECRVTLGFFLEALPEIESGSRRNFMILTLIQVAVASLVLAGFGFFQRRLARNEMQIQAERAEKERLREASLISAAINHEIKNPLHSLSLSVQMLEETCQDPDPETRRHLGILRQETRRLKTILEQVTTLGRLPAPTPRCFRVDKFLEEALPLLRPLAPEAEVTGQAPEGAVWVSDPDLLTQVLINLVKNSGEAGARRIGMTWTAGPGQAVLGVVDDGSGIAGAVRSRLFEPQISGKAHGAGMGLAICHRIVWSLGGGIEAIDRAGGGSEFRITLPRLEVT